MASAIEVAKLMSYRTAWLQQAGRHPRYEASMVKVLATEMLQRLDTLALTALGQYGPLEPDAPHPRLRGIVEQGCRWNIAPTIDSGPNEMPRNSIAARP